MAESARRHKTEFSRSVEEPRRSEHERLETLIEAFRDFMRADDPRHFLCALGAHAANQLPADTPMWLLLVGPPSCGKTETLSSFLKLPRVFPTGVITEAGLLSGSSKKEKSADSHGGLLRQVGHEEAGLILCKDIGSLLSMSRDARTALLAALREVFDGSWVRRLGVDGGRTLSWTGKAGLIGAVTPIVDRHHAVMAAMGERFLMYRMESGAEEQDSQARKALLSMSSQSKAREHVQDLVLAFMNGLRIPNKNLPILPARVFELILKLSRLVSTCRSGVVRDGNTREVLYPPTAEHPARLARQLGLLFHGLFLIGCRLEETWEILVEVGMSSMPILRRRILEQLTVGQDESATAARIAEAIGCSSRSTRRALEAMGFLGIVTKSKGSGSTGDRWLLQDWVFSCYVDCQSGFADDAEEIELELVDPLRAGA